MDSNPAKLTLLKGITWVGMAILAVLIITQLSRMLTGQTIPVVMLRQHESSPAQLIEWLPAGTTTALHIAIELLILSWDAFMMWLVSRKSQHA